MAVPYLPTFLFTGRRWDEVLALYDYRTRYYDPALGRFLRMDTIGPWGDSSNFGNPYSYVGNNPWSRLDPYGKWGLLQWLFDMPESQAGDDNYGINKRRLDAYEARQQQIRDRAIATSTIAAQHEQAVYGVEIFDATGSNGELPSYDNTYDAFLYAKDKGLDAGGNAIRIGTIVIGGTPGVLIDAGYIAVDASDGSVDPLNTGLTVLGIGIMGRGGRAAKQELEIQEAAQAIAQSRARGSYAFVTEMSKHKAFAFDEFNQFKRYWGRAPNNWVWHHIVEQSEIPRFGGKAINNLHNIVATSPEINTQLNALYSSHYFRITGSYTLTVREWLRTKSYDEVRAFGLEALDKVSRGVWP